MFGSRARCQPRGPSACGKVCLFKCLSRGSNRPLPTPLEQIHFLHVVPVPLPEIVGGLGGMDTGLVSVDPDPKEDIKHVSRVSRDCAQVAASIWDTLPLDASLTRSCGPPSSAVQISEAKEFIKRRFVTKVATKSIAYKVRRSLHRGSAGRVVVADPNRCSAGQRWHAVTDSMHPLDLCHAGGDRPLPDR